MTGDFNKDGNTDYAVVGKYDSFFNKDMSTFVAIFSVKKDKVTLEFFSKISSEKAFVCHEKGRRLKIEKFGKKYDVIIVSLTLGTDDCFAIAWDGNKYIETEFDY